MEYVVVLAIASAVSLAIIPIASSLAPRLGLIDHPDPRKVHARPVPRVGGIGIAAGTLAGVVLLLPVDELMASYLLGASVLVLFGTWDDRNEIGHYLKFFGQFVAVIPIVLWGELYVTHFPFLDDPLPATVGIPFTVIALVGMINATNHSDGLDGLAGGEAILSLVGFGLLALLAGNGSVPLIAMAAIGALAGFLRHNDHPARLFMGDSGSQFLGFTLGVLAIIVTQRVDTEISPAAVLLLLGLPIADILAVLFLRIRGRMNWFRATRNHIHHRLLDLGWSQRAAVVAIYSAHATAVAAGVMLAYTADGIVVAVYLAICAAVFGGLTLAERFSGTAAQMAAPALPRSNPVWLAGLSRRLLSVTIPAYLLALAIMAPAVRFELALGCLAAAMLLPAEPLHAGSARSILSRALIYVLITFVVYSSVATVGGYNAALIEAFLLVLIGMSILAAAWASPGRRRYEFRLTGADFLVLAVVLALAGFGAVALSSATAFPFVEFAVKLALLLYGAELLTVEQRDRDDPFPLLCAGAGVLLAIKALI